MSVISVKEIADGQEASLQLPFTREYTRVFRVRTDDPRDDQIIVGLADGVPKPFDHYTNAGGTRFDPLSLLLEIVPRRQPIDHCLWEVTCRYRMASGQVGADYGGGDGGQGKNPRPGGGGPADFPEQRPWGIGWASETMQLPLRRAFTENGDVARGAKLTVPVVNAAQQPFSPVPTYTAGYQVLTIKRLQLSYDPQQAKQYTYALNAEVFLGFARPEQAQIVTYTGDRTYLGGRPYWEQTLRIRFVPDGVETWQPELLNIGTARIPKSGEPGYVAGGPDKFVGPPIPLLDPLTQQQISEPILLGEDGQPLSAADKASGKVVYLKFARYPLRPFAALKLT